MTFADQLAALDRPELEGLLHVALIRLAFVRSTDCELEFRRLRRDFSHEDYRRSCVRAPVDTEAPR